MTEQDYICALKSIMGQARMMVKDIEGKKPSDGGKDCDRIRARRT